MKVIISGGGTAGHIIPALGVGKALQVSGSEVVFIGNKNSMEQRLNQDFRFITIDVQKIYRSFTLKHIFFPFKLGYSFGKSLLFFLKFKPDIFFGSGGFVCGAPALAALFYKFGLRKNLKIYFHEQNSFPGLVTRKLGNYAQKVFLGNKQAEKYFARSCFVGNPIQDRPVKKGSNILVVGGSQGSQFLNENFAKILPDLFKKNQIKRSQKIDWQVGENNIDTYQDLAGEKVNIFGFSKQMPEIYNRAGLVICRSGALTLAELQARGLPAVLVPLAISAGNHQYQNAVSYADSGAGIVLEENRCSPKSLQKAIFEILDNYEKFSKEARKGRCKMETSALICEQINMDFNNGKK